MTGPQATILSGAALALAAGACSQRQGDSTGPCRDETCATACTEAGYAGGRCVSDVCQCDAISDADADADADVDGGPDAGADGGDDAGPEGDGADDAGEVEVDPCAPQSCGPTELCGEAGSGDGLDNDCDGEVDEGCICPGNGVTMECFPGDPAICPPGQPCAGNCVRGTERCTEFLSWGPCNGATAPAEETCDRTDNDCDGLFDEEIPGCDSPVNCPGTVSAAPMTFVPLDGGSIFPGAYDSWEWELFCPTTVVTCPEPEDPSARDTQVLIISSGTYRARATIHADGETYTCEFAILAQGAGLRVELNWDTQGSAHGDTDVDLHLHQWGAESDFFADPQDCFYANCKASSCCWSGAPSVDWGLSHTGDLAACRDAPQGEGAEWASLGFCANPRLDVDVITCTTGDTDPASYDYCAPENINVDNPPLGEPFRIMVNYYSSHGYFGTTNATVNVYCGGALRASFGPQPLTYGEDSGEDNDNWLVADVRFGFGACGALDCEIVPVVDAGGRPVVQRGASFGPPWSTF